MNYNEIIPVLEKEVIFFPFDNSTYLVSQEKYNYEVNINEQTYSILQLIDGKKTLLEIKDLYNNAHNEKITVEVLHQLLYTKFSKFGIIENNEVEVKPMARANYLKLSKIIISEKTVNRISNYLLFLYRPYVVQLIIPLIVIIYSAIMGNYYDELKLIANDLSIVDYWYVASLSFLALIFHEFGHSSAAKYYGINSRGIGFGFYVFTPAFFTDITKAWRLTNKQRIVIDLGGIYFELVFICLLLFVFLINHNINLLATSLFLVVSTLYNLNPFFRTDGYWVVSDGLKIPNLRKQSLEKLKLFFKKIAKRNVVTFTKKDWFLVVYALVSLSFIVFFVASILIWNSDSVLYFPINLYYFIKDILTGKMNDWSLENLATITLPLVFYYLLISVAYKTIKNRKKKQKIDE